MPVSALAAAATGLLLLAATGQAQPLRVVDPAGKPVAGARIEVLEIRNEGEPLAAMFPPYAEGETDAEGRVAISLPRRQGLLVLVDHPAFLPLAQPAGGAASPLVLRPGRTWSGRLQLPTPEIPKGRICASWEESFAAWREARTWTRCAEVSPQGDFSLAGLPADPAGIVDLEAQVPGFLLLRLNTELPPGRPLRPAPGIRVSGRIVGPGDRTPVARATVRGEGSSPVESREDGSFAIAVPALPATLEVSAAGFRTRRVAIATTKAEGLAVRLEKGPQVRGTLVDEERRPVRRASFWIEEQTAGHTRSESRAVETKDGAFLLDLPEPGVFRLRVQAEGFRDLSPPEISVAPAESYALGTLVLRHGSGVAGTAVDGLTREPLAGVEVELLPAGTALLDAVAHQRIARTVTGKDGRFRIAGLTTGRFGLALRREGYAPALQTVGLEADQLQEVGEIAVVKGSLLRGRVLDREGKPRAGLTVRVLDREQSSLLPIAERATDAEGRFEGPRLAAGRYRLQVRGSRLLRDQEIEVQEGSSEPLELVAGGVHVAGQVTRGGEPVGGGSLSLSSGLDPAASRGKILVGSFAYGLAETHLSATVRADGTFDVADVPDGALTLIYSGDSVSVTRDVVVPDAARADLDVEVGGAVLRGQVVAAGERSGVEALVRVTGLGSGGLVASRPTDSQGFFAIPDLQPGSYAVQAAAEGYATRALPGVEVTEGSAPLEISLEPGGNGGLRVRLHYPDGAPAAWVPVTLLDASGALVRSLPTNGSGEKEFEGLPSGAYRLVWSDPYAGAGASEPIQIAAGPPRLVEKTLSEGGPLEIACALERCAGRRIDALSIVAASGAELGPQLSGASPALRFSADGRASLGRLSPGRYLLRLWTRGEVWSQSFSLGSGGARVEF
jgi:5-hydroxyisourate hydrolase-like protein (transthyretin family)